MKHKYWWNPRTLETATTMNFDGDLSARKAGFIRIPFRLWKVIQSLARMSYKLRRVK